MGFASWNEVMGRNNPRTPAPAFAPTKTLVLACANHSATAPRWLGVRCASTVTSTGPSSKTTPLSTKAPRATPKTSTTRKSVTSTKATPAPKVSAAPKVPTAATRAAPTTKMTRASKTATMPKIVVVAENAAATKTTSASGKRSSKKDAAVLQDAGGSEAGAPKTSVKKAAAATTRKKKVPVVVEDAVDVATAVESASAVANTAVLVDAPVVVVDSVPVAVKDAPPKSRVLEKVRAKRGVKSAAAKVAAAKTDSVEAVPAEQVQRPGTLMDEIEAEAIKQTPVGQDAAKEDLSNVIPGLEQRAPIVVQNVPAEVEQPPPMSKILDEVRAKGGLSGLAHQKSVQEKLSGILPEQEERGPVPPATSSKPTTLPSTTPSPPLSSPLTSLPLSTPSPKSNLHPTNQTTIPLPNTPLLPNTTTIIPTTPFLPPSPPTSSTPLSSSTDYHPPKPRPRIIEPQPDGKMPPQYRRAARRVTTIIVGIPVMIVTGWDLWQRKKRGWTELEMKEGWWKGRGMEGGLIGEGTRKARMDREESEMEEHSARAPEQGSLGEVGVGKGG